MGPSLLWPALRKVLEKPRPGLHRLPLSRTAQAREPRDTQPAGGRTGGPLHCRVSQHLPPWGRPGTQPPPGVSSPRPLRMSGWAQGPPALWTAPSEKGTSPHTWLCRNSRASSPPARTPVGGPGGTTAPRPNSAPHPRPRPPPPAPGPRPPCAGCGARGVSRRRSPARRAVAEAPMGREARRTASAVRPPAGDVLSCPAHRRHPSSPGARGTHLASAEDVRAGDAHVEVPEHRLRLLPGLQGAVHPEAAPLADLGPELRGDAGSEP